MSFYNVAVSIAYPLRGDPVASDLNRHLSQQDAEAVRSASIDAIAENLLKDDYSPFLPQNVAEALGEIPQDQLAVVACGLRIKGFDGVGSFLHKYVESYWKSLAHNKAEFLYDEQNRACRECGGYPRHCGEC